jgi:hypothetical protein
MGAGAYAVEVRVASAYSWAQFQSETEAAAVTEPYQSDNTPLRCRHCGSNRISVPDRSKDDSIVTCTDCGDEIRALGRGESCSECN